MSPKQGLRRVLFQERVRHRSRRQILLHWVVVIALILLGMKIGSLLEEHHVGMNFRYITYRALQKFRPGNPFVQSTVVVVIGDEEYWKGDAARRVPINREYLAKIIGALAEAQPKLIAVDFDLRSPTPDGKPYVEHPDYEKERQVFLKTVDEISKHVPVVLPETVTLVEGSYYLQESDIYDDYAFHSGKVLKGYINLPFDYRMVPLTLLMRDGTPVKSMSEAIVENINPEALKHIHKDGDFPYGRWLSIESFENRHLVSATEVLNHNAEAFEKIRGNVAIMGSAWSKSAYGRGPFNDEHFTPVGDIPGVFMHANYVEALLGERTYGRWGEISLKILEFTISLALASIFAWPFRPLVRFIMVFLLCLFLLFLSYLSFLNLGRFFDFFVPTILVLGHAGFEQLREWRTDSHEYHKLIHAKGDAK